MTRDLLLEIACDESGSDGENLIEGSTRVFAHGSTDLGRREAEQLMELLAARVGFAGQELKSTRLLKGPNLTHILEIAGPFGVLAGRVKVSVTDKAYMAVCKVVDLVIEEAAYRKGIRLHDTDAARQMARDLFAEGPRAYGSQTWDRLLREFVSFVRATQRKGAKTTHEELLATIDDLRLVSRRRRVDTVMQLLWDGRAELEAYSREHSPHADEMRTLDPLIPSVMETARAWHEATGRTIFLVHDRQSSLTENVRNTIVTLGNWPHRDFPGKVPIADFVLADSRDDARIQVADIVAGLGRLAASAALKGRLDSDVAAAVRPALIESSLWGDTASSRQLFG